MPDSDRLLLTLRRSIQAFRDTPGRCGRLVALEGVREVLATGDLHGNLANFRQLLKLADLGQNPERHLVLQEVIHSGFCYPDGSDKSHQLLDLLSALKCQYPRQVHFLLGNHELSQMTNRLIAKGDADLNRLFRAGVDLAYGERSEEMYAHYLQLLAVVPLALRTPNRIFLSHSLPSGSRLDSFDLAVLQKDSQTEADLLPGGSVHSLVWGRDTSQENVSAFLRKVDADLLISGHIPCEQGHAAPNASQLILDSLAYPAAYCLFPTDRPLTLTDLLSYVRLL